MDKSEIAGALHRKVRYMGNEYYLIRYQLCRDDNKAYHQLVLRDINADSETVCRVDDVEIVGDSKIFRMDEIYKRAPKQPKRRY